MEGVGGEEGRESEAATAAPLTIVLLLVGASSNTHTGMRTCITYCRERVYAKSEAKIKA